MAVTKPATLPAPTTVEGAPVFIPAAHRKVLSAGDIPALVARYIVGADDALVRPSDIRLSVSVLKAGMGGKPSLDSFINGLAGIAARLAWGAIKADAAADGLPPFAQWAIQQADAGIISRKGISAGLLRALVADVVTRTAALPIRTVAKKADKGRTLPAPAADAAPAAPAPTAAAPAAVDRAAAAAELARMTRAVADTPINTRDAIPHEMAGVEQADASAALDASAARCKADAESRAAADAARKADAESRALAELTAEGQSAHLRAVAFCRLADTIGIKLTKAQLATLDAFEGKRVKVSA